MEERDAIEAELRRRFRFSKEDLEVNRAGQLTAAQHRFILKRQLDVGALRLLVGGFALSALIMLFIDVWTTLIVMSAIATLLVLPLWWFHSVRTRRKPFSVTGRTRFRRGNWNNPSDRFQVGPWWRRVSFPGVADDAALVESLPRATAYFSCVPIGPDRYSPLLLLSIEPA